MPEPLDLSNQNNNLPQKSKVTKLQEKLYSPNTQFQIRERQIMKRPLKDVPSSWGDIENSDFSSNIGKKRISFFTKMLIVSFIFFVSALSFVLFRFNGGGNTVYSNAVSVILVGPVSVGGGEELSIDVIIQNNHSFPINTVDLVIEYPEGTKTVDLRNDLPRFREGLGDIEANTIVKKTYKSYIFGTEGDLKNIDVRAEYRVPNSNAIFESRKSFELVLQSAPLRLVVDTVKEITSGQALSFDVTVASNSNSELQNILVTVDYPFGFNFSESTIPPNSGKNIWFFEKLYPQESKKFTVRGSLIGQNNEERVFKWNIGLSEPATPEEFKIKFTTLPKSITLIKPFLAMDFSVDGEFGVDIVRKGAEQLGGRLTYTNNTGGTIVDPQIVLKLDGEVLDDPSVNLENGFFNSSDNTITWNKITNPAFFTKIDVGQSATLDFNFRSKVLATRQAVYKNPEIVVNASITGKRIGEGNVPEDIKVNSVKRIKFESDVNFVSVANHLSGPLPPKVENDSVYAIRLDVKNSSNLLQRGRMRAVLPPYVLWNNAVSPSSEKVTYIPSSRSIEWDLGDIREHVGYIDPARSITLDLTLTPSTSQLGQAPELLKEVTFTAFDSFTQTEINESIKTPTTDQGRISDLDGAKVVQ
jgi:hypothetical protein